MRIAFIIDPIERLQPHHDTSFALMLEAQRRGHEVYDLRIHGLFARHHEAWAVGRRVEVMRPEYPGAPHFRAFEERCEPLHWFDAVLMRKDPPFDREYLYATLLLSLVDPASTFVMNDPRGLRDANEKLYSLHFPDLIPPTIVTSGAHRLTDCRV